MLISLPLSVQRPQAARITAISRVSSRGQCQRRRRENAGLLQPAESTPLSARWHWDSQKWRRTAEGSEGRTEPAKRERKRLSVAHSIWQKWNFRAGCLETLLPARGSSPAAAAPPPSSASPARGAQPQSCRLWLRAREQPSRLPTQHLLPQDKGSLPPASIDPMFPTLMENMVIWRKASVNTDRRWCEKSFLLRCRLGFKIVWPSSFSISVDIESRRYSRTRLSRPTRVLIGTHCDSVFVLCESEMDRLYYCLLLDKLA